jgi:Zn-dependent peptidase ImmA (M78 family)
LYRSAEITETDKAAVDDFVSLSKDYSSLENLLELQNSAVLPCTGAPIKSKPDAILQGHRAAVQLRHHFMIGEAPVLDLDKVLEQRGVKVVERSLPNSKVCGFSVTSADFGHAIFVNSHRTRERRLFTLAHELGHLSMDRDHTTTLLTEKQEQESLAEVRANSFAATFLMPDLAVKEALLKLGVTEGEKERINAVTIDYLRKQFGVSYDAMLWRLVNLKVITKKEREGLLPYAVEDALPNGVTSLSLPERYKALAVEAYRRAKISIGKLADLLRIDIYEARKLVKQFGIQQLPA